MHIICLSAIKKITGVIAFKKPRETLNVYFPTTAASDYCYRGPTSDYIGAFVSQITPMVIERVMVDYTGPLRQFAFILSHVRYISDYGL